MIGIFDSGLGGLTVAQAIRQTLKDASYIYLGDTARTPYGNKSAETVTRYALENTAWLLKQGATMIVIACNTASALATKAVREKYPTIPIFEVITPAARVALLKTSSRAIGVLATRATILSQAYQNILREGGATTIQSVSAPLLVPLIEEGWLDDEETDHILHRYLGEFKESLDTLILGCTHYPLIAPLVKKFFKDRVEIVSSGEAVARAIESYLAMNTNSVQTEINSQRKYFATDLSPHLNDLASRWLAEPVKFEKVTME